MSDNMSVERPPPDANGITHVHTDGDQDIQRDPSSIQPGISNRQSNRNYTPTLQTLKNFLATCHTLNQATKIFDNLGPQDQDIDTPPLSLQGKVYPRSVAKSLNFMAKQMEVWQLLLKDAESSFQQPVFPSAEYVHDKFFVVETVGIESQLCPFDRLGVSATVLTLVRHMLGDHALSKAAGIGGDIVYGSAGRRSFSRGAAAEPQFHDDPLEDSRYRGLSLFLNIKSDRSLPVVAIEYRPKDFFLDSSMIAALENGDVPTRDFSGDDTSPAGVITAMITQLFNYMVASGVNYGYLYSIDGIVFLEVQKDPTVVHYFVSLPRDEVDNHVESTMPYSAVSQIFAFVIRAMRATSSSMRWIEQADEHTAWKSQVVARESSIDGIAVQLQQWENPSASSAPCDEDQEKMDTDADSSGNEFDGESYDQCDFDIGEETSMSIEIRMDADLIAEDLPVAATTPLDQHQDQMQGLTSQDEQFVQNDGEEDTENQSEDRQESMQTDGLVHEDEDMNANAEVDSSSRNDDIKYKNQISFNKYKNQILLNKKDPFRYNRVEMNEAPYCTQRCLLGVANGLPLDPACPNVHLHGNQHISKEDFKDLAEEQISRSGQADGHCSAQFDWGSIGVIFKVTLVDYGYTFVAKATLRANWTLLHREGELYNMAREIQGSYIPVYFGIVRVFPEFRHDDGRYLSQFMLLSWAGEPVFEACDEGEMSSLSDSVFKAYSELHRVGIQHRDLDLANMTYNSELGRIMLVDFDKARLHPDRQAELDAQAEDFGEGEYFEADGSIRKNDPNPPPVDPVQEAIEAEAKRKNFVEECGQELIHAVKAIDWLVKSSHGQKNN